MRSRPSSLPLLALAGGLAGCAAPRPSGPALYEKGRHQFLFHAEGHLLRSHFDGNADGRVDVIRHHREDGAVARVEVDSDYDGRVDRWVSYGPDRIPERVALSRRRTGRPDTWLHLDGTGRPWRSEFDDDGDGRADRVEDAGEEREARDTDGDGRPDRWLVRRDGRTVAEEIDVDGDGRPDRRLVRGPAGEVLRVESELRP